MREPGEGWVAPSQVIFDLGIDRDYERLLDEEYGLIEDVPDGPA